MIKVKNTKSEASTWCGMTIEPAAYYEPEVFELDRWRNNSLVLTDIASGDLIISDGTVDITDVAAAINLLKDLQTKNVIIASNQPFASKTLSNGKKLYKRESGIQQDLIAGLNWIYFTIPFPWVKIIGVEILFGEAFDYTDLYILDTATGTYSTIPNYPLNQFGYAVNIAAGEYEENNPYDADLYQDMQVAFHYYSQSAKRIAINFNISEVKT